MTAIDLVSSDITKQEELEDITTCIICTEVFTDPRALPCIHTFCMKCIQETGIKTNKEPGDEMPCPICRRPFKIPAEGFPGLPKHFFIERLIQLSKVSDPSVVTKVLCTVCLEETKEHTDKETQTAEAHCLDCKHSLCKECYSEHKKFKLTKNHKLVPIKEYIVDHNGLTRPSPSVCEVHEQKVLDVYCADCKSVLCAICFIEGHRNHDGSHVNKCMDDFRKQIQSKAVAIIDCIAKAQMKKTEFQEVKKDVQKQAKNLESDIEKRKYEIKQLADEQATNLLQGLCSETQSRLKDVQLSTDDIDAYISNLESYNFYCQRILAKGSASDICRAVCDLSTRAFELQEECQRIVEKGIQQFKLCFGQTELRKFTVEDCGNYFGKIEEQCKEIAVLKQESKEMKADYNAHMEKMEKNKSAINTLQTSNDQLKQELHAEKSTNNSLRTRHDKLIKELDKYEAKVKLLETNAEKLTKKHDATKIVELQYKSDPVLVQTIRTKSTKEKKTDVCGLTILDKELFVISGETSEVEVYDAVNFSFSRRWNLKGLNYPMDIASCNRNKCLYIFNYKFQGQSKEVLRIRPDGKLIKKWSTGDDWGSGLSVTHESNILLIATSKNKLNEYSPDGQLILEINLLQDAGIRHPLHAIKLTNDNFLVSHGSLFGLHRVCLIDDDGKLKKSFGTKSGSTNKEMSSPDYLCVDGNGYVMVADRANCRVLLLDSDLKFKRAVLWKGKHGLKNPMKILLDEPNGRLLVADNESDNQRILFFDLKFFSQ